ncbi:MAG: NAD-dependent epimerase/dehydratase family protein [Burkholderiaceae bacterium]
MTGANGHLGNNLVRALLERGYKVRASVRDASDPAKSKLLPVPDIELLSLDVRDAKRFAEAAGGVDFLFHVAATYRYFTGSRVADEEMIRDSVDGAAAALHAAAASRVGRVVLTSSVVTLPLAGPGDPPKTEDDWRTDLRMPYFRAKVEAEREAWRIAAAEGVDLVTVLPGAIIGPGFTRTTPSTDAILGIMLGGMKMGAPDSNMPVVDIRDVVSGHILAAESGKAGRFAIINDEQPSFLELARIMHAIDPEIPLSRRKLPDFLLRFGPFFEWLNHRTLGTPRLVTSEFIASMSGKRWAVSNERARRELGWRPEIPLDRSLADTIAVLRKLQDSRS